MLYVLYVQHVDVEWDVAATLENRLHGSRTDKIDLAVIMIFAGLFPLTSLRLERNSTDIRTYS